MTIDGREVLAQITELTSPVSPKPANSESNTWKMIGNEIVARQGRRLPNQIAITICGISVPVGIGPGDQPIVATVGRGAVACKFCHHGPVRRSTG